MLPFLAIVIALVSIVGLMIIHETGHFLMALAFKMPVEEFGLGIPPRLFARRFGSWTFSLNLLPFGAFVKIKGEEGQEAGGFNSFPAWQRAIVFLGGVVATWVAAVILFTVIAGHWGLPYAVSDQAVAPQARLQITSVAPNSPAEKAGLRAGDWVTGMGLNGKITPVYHSAEFTKFISLHRGETIDLQIKRPRGTTLVSLSPRRSPPAGEGAIGVSFARVLVQHYSWWQAPKLGLMAAINQTIAIPQSLGMMFIGWIHHRPMAGATLVGPIGIGQMIAQMSQLGWGYLLQFVALIAVYLSLFNILPLPALDGGKLMFLIVEVVRKKPVSAKIQASLENSFFIFFMLLLFLVTIKDVIHLF